LLARGLCGFTLIVAAAAANAQLGGDLQAQILYAYQTEDANALLTLIRDLTAQVKADESNFPLRYQLAHAEYRRGLLADDAPREAESAYGDCVDELKPLVAQDVKSAEVLVLQSACYFGLANHKKLEAVLLRARADERLKAALSLEPRNPRAVFLSSLQGLREAKPGSPERQQAFAQLRLAVQLFEASSATRIDAPGWGHADAYLALGLELKSRGDHVGARNYIERSLIAAPDYKAAQRELAQLVRP
jgi:tetratricopeptide (TPR) repeat protein